MNLLHELRLMIRVFCICVALLWPALALADLVDLAAALIVQCETDEARAILEAYEPADVAGQERRLWALAVSYDRRVIIGIFCVLRIGIPWADLPSEYGPPTTVNNRFNRWSYAGHWDRIMDAIAEAHNVDTVMVDGTSVRAHHPATTLKKTRAAV